ncbi:MAG TPA: aminotransferase class I/II-fold pyridoxal phosphate-dependent enzyme [Acidisphaera sp.]|nr:aminotransferase class I/II-fold pyridoxal phosphate-dependent enzyme [Acidisphaera sp.]
MAHGIFGLSDDAKRLLLHRFSAAPRKAQRGGAAPADRMADLPGRAEMETIGWGAEKLGIANPFFRMHDGIAGAETSIEGRRCLNFASYDYLGLNGHPKIAEAVAEAVARYGTSVSASRLVAGERPLHRQLEQALAAHYRAEDCLAFVSGHATNVTVVGSLLRPGDLIVHDELIHNSAVQGAVLSGARRLAFRHNDAAAARHILAQHRASCRRALIVIEGHYSMDGDIPDLPAFTRLAREQDAWLMVDEAHALGVLGDRGGGSAEHTGIDPGDVDIWMGTLSKALVSCGGYIAGKRSLIHHLRLSAPGFVYSVGLSPPGAAAATAALGLLERAPDRVGKLRRNASAFLTALRGAGFDTGTSTGAAIVPVIVGSSAAAARLSQAMFDRAVNVQPIIYPAVPERSARLRFFLSASHEPEQLERAVALLKDAPG